jgi:hypothetical protein
MRRRSILGIAAVAALGIAGLSDNAVSQQRSLKEQLVGSWSFATAVTTLPNGSKVETFGPNPRGLLIFDANGRYASLVVRPGVAKFASNSRETGTADENKAAMQGAIAHAGRYTVNEADRTVTFHIEQSSFPNWNGIEQRRPITVSGDDMRYTVPTSSIGGTAEVTFKRAK